MNLRFIDWIWHVRGSVALGPGQSSTEAFGQLDALFRQAGTSHERMADTLHFRKRDQAAQDRMSIFDGGVLRIEPGMAGPVLRYDLLSRALLFCFLAPLLFLGIARATIVLVDHQTAAAKIAAKPKEPVKADVPMNAFDQAMGAPAPEPKKKDKKADERDKKLSPTPAYVFAAIFATLYVGGRILEDRLVKALFRRSLAAA